MKRKIASVVAILCLALLLDGCGPISSIFGLYTKDDKAFEKDLIGTWKFVVTDPDNSDKDIRWSIQQSDEESFYNFKWGAVGAKGGFVAKARLVRIGSFLFIDFEGKSDETMESQDSVVAFPAMPVHMIGRVWLEKNKLEIHFLKEDWVKAQAKAGALSLAHLDIDDGPLLTANTDELRKFMQQHANDEEALSENYSLVREK